jgi:hypothetical protein
VEAEASKSNVSPHSIVQLLDLMIIMMQYLNIPLHSLILIFIYSINILSVF